MSCLQHRLKHKLPVKYDYASILTVPFIKYINWPSAEYGHVCFYILCYDHVSMQSYQM